MGILSNIFAKIFPSGHPATQAGSDAAVAGSGVTTAAPGASPSGRRDPAGRDRWRRWTSRPS